MNLETATPEQKEVITTLDKPLMVAAGAGSGKTFTLTQRVVYALLPSNESEQSAYLQSIDEVLATTFTKKAAGELKSRIKKQLLSEGLVGEALKTDNAWISTIHGICSHILRENAFLLHIDPAFEVIANEDARVLMEQAFESVVSKVRQDHDKAILELFEVYDGARVGGNGSAVFEMACVLIDKALSTRKGFDSICLPIFAATPNSILRQMIELGESYLAVAQSWIKPNATDVKYLQALEGGLAIAQAYMTDNSATSFSDEAFDCVQFLQVFYSFPKTSPKYRAKKEDASFFIDYRLTYAKLSSQVDQAIGTRFASALVRLASLVYERFQALKGPSLLDNTDQLRKAVWALDTYPEIANALRERFNLVMIDEFQDTDQLQVALFESILHEDGSNLCTVGDAQQSIYRFRGADISAFYGFREYVKAQFSEPQFINLPDNFRSHKDILSFVDFIFSTPQFFGEQFLSLKPRAALNDVHDAFFDNEPRIKMQVIDIQGSANMADARRRAAQEIAQHFSRLRDAGVSPSDMVLLLGSMTKAHYYAEALQEADFESVITGGSIFSEAAEVALIGDLLRVCVNPYDSLALYNVFVSDLFAISDSILLALATTEEEGRIKKQDIALGFMHACREDFNSLSLEEIEILQHAKMCLEHFCQEASKLGVVYALKRLFVSTGYLSRLEELGAQGLATAGNVYKALDMLTEFEALGMGVSQISDSFVAKLSASKESPGILSTSSSSFVKIMTIHASKGLEFPHVALSELSSGVAKEESFFVEADRGITQILLKPKLSESQRKISNELKKLLLDSEEYEGNDAEVSFLALRERRAHKELDEAKRLLYVALTRASKSLLLSCMVKGNASFDYSRKGIIDDLKTVIGWNSTDEFQRIPYGGTMPLSFSFISLKSTPEQVEEKDSTQEVRYALSTSLPQIPALKAFENTNSNIVSYSSLAQGFDDDLYRGSLSSDKLDKDGLVIDSSLSKSRDEALEFGRAFHRCAQKFVLEARSQANRLAWLSALDKRYVNHLKNSQGLSERLENRLNHAFSVWLLRDEIKRLFACDSVDAEVPFMVALPIKGKELFLEGEIDALGICSNSSAFFIDYKTGGMPSETAEEVYQKHLLQAQCYSYALLKEGFSRVTGVFVRVDFLTQQSLSCVDSVTYSFDENDQEYLKEAILLAYKSNE